MARPRKYSLFAVLWLMVVLSSGSEERKSYIVYMGYVPDDFPSDLHHGMLASVTGSHELARQSMIHSYRRSFNAFAARLTRDEAKKLAETEGVVSVFPNTLRKLHTTRSWDFLGLPQNVRRNLKFERDIIIGMIDTGLSPHSQSFQDTGLGAPPARWKGECEKSAHFNCNKKIIGARYYRLDPSSPAIPDSPELLSTVDTDGHGTHTGSTAAGVPVPGASLYGLANGTARSAVPGARLAAYKVCWSDTGGCNDIDILAAFDDAIADGVDVLSVSIGGRVKAYYFQDTMSIGTFHAMAKGIITVMSAGNSGPYTMQIDNVAPWVITVAASTSDRQFVAKLGLGNGVEIIGQSVNTFSPKKKSYPLFSPTKKDDDEFGFFYDCSNRGLDPEMVKGKIVLCDLAGFVPSFIRRKGGEGVILNNSELPDTAFTYVLPAVKVDANQSSVVYNYFNSTESPSAVIYRSRAIYTSTKVASFSSRGPNKMSPRILKPDIAAPGIDILAAFSPLTTETNSIGDNRVVNFNVLSGTSMACPHVSSAAAYVKSFHPHWSPSTIKSALMTTAKALTDPNNEFAYGAGLIDPVKAVHPGLIYDLNQLSYAQFLCSERLSGEALAIVTAGQYHNCSALPAGLGYDALNYPTMQVEVRNGSFPIHAVFHRTVTNVGSRTSVYKAIVDAPSGLGVTVTPQILSFTRRGQRLSFTVEVKHEPLGNTSMVSASLVWDDSHHRVRSPIVAYQYVAFEPKVIVF